MRNVCRYVGAALLLLGYCLANALLNGVRMSKKTGEKVIYS